MSEMWKNVEEYSKYQVSNHRRIKSFKRYKEGEILKIKKNNRGYRCVSLYKNNKGKPKSIHIIVYETFNNYKLKKDECVHHDDENKENNYINNLKKMTLSEHSILHNTGEKNHNFGKNHSGENNPNFGNKHTDESKELMSDNHCDCKGEKRSQSKLSEIDVYDIRKCLKLKWYSIEQISLIFNISKYTILDIKYKRSWKHLK